MALAAVATSEFDAPPMAARDRVIQIVASMHGEFFVLTASGRIFKHTKNDKDTDPATKNRLLWVEIATWDLPK